MKTVSLILTVLVLAGTAPSQANIVQDWNFTFLQAVRKETPPPCLVSRNLPMFHLTVHRAVQAAVKAGMNEDEQARVAHHAARSAFLIFFPSQTQMAEAMDAKSLTGSLPDESRRLAREAVERTFKERENDGTSTTIHYVPHANPGQWRRTPPAFRPPEFPHWAKVKPFVVGDVSLLRAPPPPPLSSTKYAEEVNLLREIGGRESTLRTPEQTMIAKFWADFSYTSSPPGHWNEIAREVSAARKLNLQDTARVFATLNLALADTCIAVWDSKYHYNYWRPVTAIRRADEDGNDATQPDKQWEPLLKTPPHPDYLSGHSGISGAAATVMTHFFGTENLSFEASSDDVKDVKRKFTSFQACAEEVSMSRVYGGIHHPSACNEGLALGRRVAEKVLVTFKE